MGGALERWWTSSSGQHVETCTGGRQGCVCTWCRSAGRTCRRKLRARRPLLPPPYKSLASKARRPMSARRCPHPAPASPPGRPPSPRTPRSSLSPQRAVRCRAHPAPAPVVQTVHWLASHAVSTRGVEQPPHPSHRAPRHACPLAPHVRASPHSAPSALALTALSPRCSDCAPPLLTRCRHTRLPVTEPTRSHG